MMNPMQSAPMPMGQPQGGPQGFSAPAAGINLFKVQEQLKDMPQQAIMAYANGSNPDMVPPYIALGEMERRTRAAKNAQTGEAPQGTVKDNLENQIKQTAGIASLGNMRQQQMGQAQAQQAMNAPGAVPGGVPQPEPQPEAPVMMARGGLASVPISSRMSSYRDGGIVGYAGGGDVEDEDEDLEDADGDDGGAPSSVMIASAQTPRVGTENPMDAYAAQTAALMAQMGKRGPAPKSQAEMLAELAKTNPEKAAMLNRDVEGDYLKRLTELQAKQGENDIQSKEALQARRRMDLWQSLIAGGEGSRGRGIGGLMAGMGTSLGRSAAERMDEEAALRDLPLKRQEIMAKAQYEMQGLQRARAEGDLKAAAMHQQNLAKLENEAKKAEMGAMGRSVGAAGNVAGRYMSGEAAKEAARIGAAQRLESTKIAAKSREGIASLRGAGTGKTPPTPVDIEMLLAEYKELVKANTDPKITEPENVRAERVARIADIRRQLEAFGLTGKRQAGPAPVPAPSAGPVKITNDAEYNALASGTVFIGPDNEPRRKP